MFTSKFICLRGLSQNTSIRYFGSSLAKYDKIGFIGLGNMGNHMARNLVKGGHEVLGCDLNEAAVQTLVKDGGKAVSSPAELAKQANTIVTMLPTSTHVKSVYTGKDGLFSNSKKGSLFIDSTTMEPEAAQEMQAAASERGMQFIDAPVSGGIVAAQNAGLTFMVGGDSASFERAKPILLMMGKNAISCGKPGMGQVTKICNNMLLAIEMIGTCETFNLGMRMGMDAKLLASAINVSSGRCWSTDTYNPVPGVLPNLPAANDYKGGFLTHLMTKDLGLAQHLSNMTKSPTPMGSLAHQIYRVMCNRGYAHKDFGSAFRFLQE